MDDSRRRVVLYGMTSGVSARGFMRGQGPFLRERGWQVALACSSEGGVAEFAAAEGLDFRPLPLERNPSLRHDLAGWTALWRTLRAVRPDVTVWGSPKASLLGVAACRLQRVPAVYVVHGLRLEGASGAARAVLWLLEWLTCRLATVVVADGYGLRELVERLRLAPKGRVVVLADGSANGVDAVPSTPHYREDLGLTADDVVVTFAGRITRDKGIAELVEAWKEIARTTPEAHLVVAGRADDADRTAGDLERALRALPRTHLLGHVDDLERLWADTDVMVLPSYREGLPLVVIEAAAAGVPAVVTDCTGGPEAVEDGVTGIVVPRRDSAALAAGLHALLTDSGMRSSYGVSAQHRARLRYHRPRLWTALDDLLKKLVGAS